MQLDKSTAIKQLNHRHLVAERHVQVASVQDDMLDVAWLINILRRGRRVLIASILIALVVGAVYCVVKTRRYEAVGEIAVHPEESGALNLEDAADSALGSMGGDFNSKLETQVRVLKSTTLAGIVISDLHLDQKPEFNPYLKRGSGIPDYVKQARVLKSFADDLTVQSVPRTQAIEIRFRSEDPELAAAVVNDLARAYQEHNFITRYEATHQASTWLSHQLADLKSTVEDAQQRLAEYQKEHGIIGTDENNNLVMARLDDLSRQMTDAEADRITKEAKYKIAQTGDPALVQSIATDTTLPALEEERASLQNQLADAQTTYGSAYPRVVQLKAQLAETQKSIEQTLANIRARYKNELEEAQNTERSLRSELDQQKQAAYQLSDNFSQYGILKEDVNSGRTLYEDLLSKLQEAGIVASLRSSNVEIIDAATRPIKPVEPQLLFVMAFSLFSGVVVGIGLVFLYDRVDQRLSSLEEAEWLSRMPLFGVIPDVDANVPGTTPKSLALMAAIRPKAQFSESFRTLRTAIMLASADAPPRIMLVTGSVPGEGKSTVSANCAVVLAHSGKRILLVDADMRRGRMDQALGVSSSIGLSECLAGVADWRKVVRSIDDAPLLDFLSHGARPPSPADLLGSARMQRLIEEWSSEYDHIVLDTPPALLVTDALVLTRYADVVITVARYHHSNRHALRRASELLMKAAPPIIGLVVNALDLNQAYYGYNYGYSSDIAAYEAYYDDEKTSVRTKA